MGSITPVCATLALTLILIPAVAFGGNLVPNPSFEVYTRCPVSFSEIASPDFWHQPAGGTSDYFNACATGVVNVPGAGFGQRTAHAGDAMAGILAYTTSPPEYREYVAVPLRLPLEAGETYAVSYFVSLAKGARYAVEEIGAHFAIVHPGDLYTGKLSLTTHAPSSTSGFLDDRDAWTEVSGSYLATGGEEWLIIGNLHSDAQTPLSDLGPYPGVPIVDDGAYYYIDSVSVDVASAGAPVEVDFEALEHADDQNVLHGVQYSEDGYRVWATFGAELYSYGTGHDSFGESTAVNSQLTASLTDLAGTFLTGGNPYNLVSIDVTEGDAGVTPNTPLTFVGEKSSGDLVQQTFLLDGIAFVAQRFEFEGFDDIVRLEIPQPGAFPRTQQFDNIRICDPLTCSGVPAPLEEHRYCINGSSTGIGWSWQLSGGPIVNVPGVPNGWGAEFLTNTFFKSINTLGPSGSFAWQDFGLEPHCFEVAYEPGYTLSVGPFNGTPNCVVTGNVNACTFNPTIIDAVFLPPPPGAATYKPLPVGVPALPHWPIVAAMVSVVGYAILRTRSRPRAA